MPLSIIYRSCSLAKSQELQCMLGAGYKPTLTGVCSAQMHTPPLTQPGKIEPGQWSRGPGTPRLVAMSGALPPCPAPVMAARLVVPAAAAGAAWTAYWIGPFYAFVLALWACWAVTACAKKLPVSGPLTLRQAGFGERIWLSNLRQAHLPKRLGVIPALYLTAWTGLAVSITGGLFLSPLVTATGLLVGGIGQFVCLQRLAGLYRAERNSHPLYRFWEVEPANDDHVSPKPTQDGTLPPRRRRRRSSIR